MTSMPLFDRPGVADDGEGEGPAKERVYRVGEVNRTVRMGLESTWKDVWIEGELSNVKRAASGHVYFTLNDETETAAISAVMFRSDASRAKATLADGQVVRLRGTLSLYEARGSFQLIARLALPAGAGQLHAEFERIRKKLEAEGLFDQAKKRPLPRLPSVVGVVTSASGAALHDIVQVARGRCPVRIVVADCRVQGDGAPASIVAAIQAIQVLDGLDVVIVARGGGSAEDLWAFNDESVARAIATCRVPVVSGVGHEVDVTIADFAADARAATPSNAAEMVVPDRAALLGEVDSHRRHLERAFSQIVDRGRIRLEKIARHLADPRHAVGGVRGRLADLAHGLERAMRKRLAKDRAQLGSTTQVLARLDARRALARDRKALGDANARLRSLSQPLVSGARLSFMRVVASLHALSPLAVLSRGYAVALSEKSGRALLRADDATPGDALRIRLHEGTLLATVTGKDADASTTAAGGLKAPRAPRKSK